MGGAWWELDELAVNQSILRGRRGRLRLGAWGGERLRQKGGFRARIEALLAVWGQAARGGGEKVVTSGPLGVKEQRVAAAARCGPQGDFPSCALCWPDRTSARWDEGCYDGDPVCIRRRDARFYEGSLPS